MRGNVTVRRGIEALKNEKSGMRHGDNYYRVIKETNITKDGLEDVFTFTHDDYTMLVCTSLNGGRWTADVDSIDVRGKGDVMAVNEAFRCLGVDMEVHMKTDGYVYLRN